MGIGAISGIGGMSSYGLSDYRISSVSGNPRSTSPIEKIGSENYKSKPLAIVSKDNGDDDKKITGIKDKPFDFEAAINQMRIGSRFNANNIPVADLNLG